MHLRVRWRRLLDLQWRRWRAGGRGRSAGLVESTGGAALLLERLRAHVQQQRGLLIVVEDWSVNSHSQHVLNQVEAEAEDEEDQEISNGAALGSKRDW